MTWTDIDGWLTLEEGRALQMLASGRYVIEFGSYKGRSTCCLAETARSVLSIDHHQGDRGTSIGDTWEEFTRNLDACGIETRPLVDAVYGKRVSAWRRSIESASGVLFPRSAGMLFIDAAHDAESVERHTRIATNVVILGGTIAWHDWDLVEVRIGVKACGLEPTGFAGTLAWMTVGLDSDSSTEV